MKKLLQIIILLFFSSSVMLEARENPSRKNDLSKNWYVGVSIKLADKYRIKKLDNGYFSEPDSLDISRFGLNTGFIVRHDLNDRIQFETGLFFNNKGYKSREFFLAEYNYSPLYGSYVNYFKLQNFYDFWYMDIPLKFHYRFSNTNFFFSAGAGIIFNICLSARNNGTIMQVSNNGPSSVPYYNFNSSKMSSSGWSGIGELAVNYSSTNSLISLGPFYERSLFAAGSSEHSQLFLYSYGVGINFSHRF